MKLNIFQKKTQPNTVDETPKKNFIVLDGKSYEITPLTFEELVEVAFLVTPFIKDIKSLRAFYRDTTTVDNFRFMGDVLTKEWGTDNVIRIYELLLHLDGAILRKFPAKDIIFCTPKVIRVNNLMEAFALFQKLGIFDDTTKQ